MKNFLNKIQTMGNKAEQFVAAIEKAPAQAASIRERAMQSLEQLRQMRTEVQSGLLSLQTNNDQKLLEAVLEIDENVEVFHNAGYEVEDVEIEFTQPPRLVVHLEKIKQVPHSVFRSLLSAHEHQKTIHVLLTALVKGEDVANDVAPTNLEYHKLIIYVGVTATFRLCWRAIGSLPPLPGAATQTTTVVTPTSTVTATTVAGLPPATVGQASNFDSIYGQSAFFASRAPAAAPAVEKKEAHGEESAGESNPSHLSKPVPTVDESKDPLARFKKMPDLRKR